MDKQQRQLNKNSITSVILREIADSTDDILTTGYQPVAVARYGLDGVYRMRAAREAAERRKALKRLEEKKLIQVRVEGEKYWAALTKKGVQEILRQKVFDTEPLPENRTCVVVFDIPELHRKLRKSLRKFLDHAGFFQLQRSVWISPFDAQDSLQQLFRSSGANKWVRVFTTKDL